MDPTQLQELLASVSLMAKASQDMAAELQASRAQNNAGDASQTPTTQRNDNPGAVAIAGIKVPLDLGTDAEERLINFTEWKEEIADKMKVAGITDDNTNQTTIALYVGRT